MKKSQQIALGKRGFRRGRLPTRKLGSGLSDALKAKPQSLHMYDKKGPVKPGDVIFKLLIPVGCAISDIVILVYDDPSSTGDVLVDLTVEASGGSTVHTQKVTRGSISSFDDFEISRGNIVIVGLNANSAKTSDIMVSFVASAGVDVR